MASRGKIMVDLCKIPHDEMTNYNQISYNNINNNNNNQPSNSKSEVSNEISETVAVENYPVEYIINDNIIIESIPVIYSDINFIEENNDFSKGDNFIKINEVLTEENVPVFHSGVEQPDIELEYETENLSDKDYVPEISDTDSAEEPLNSLVDQSEEELLKDKADELIQNEEINNNNDESLTKQGNPRKRKKYNLSLQERKAQKLQILKEVHPVLSPCDAVKCRFKCITKISEDRRKDINTQFWSLTWLQRRSFILNNSTAVPLKRPSLSSKRKHSFLLSFTDQDRQRHRVCKSFLLTTLGYMKSNDWVVNSVLSKTDTQKIDPASDKRGKHPAVNKINRDDIINHIESFNPCISHYRREHAPNMRYLPSDVTVSSMHIDFLEKFPNTPCSYDLYRKVVKDKKISFTKLGHEECETCEEFQLHDKNHTKDSIDETCEHCKDWLKHIKRANNARDKYRTWANIVLEDDTICVSADLQKVIMLPRIDSFKKVVFTKRIVAYHESFVPVGKNSKILPFAVLWHEAISGRTKEDLISTFYMFLLKNRDKKRIVMWLDNCSSQNKNWTLFSFLIFMINSTEIEAESIELFYFEPGHTFMSADHFHHQIKLSLKHQKKTYDFPDFVVAVKAANKSRVEVYEMRFYDFFEWKDYTSLYKVNKLTPRPYLADMVNVKAERGKQTIMYRCDFDGEMRDLDFLNKKAVRFMDKPKSREQCCGISEEKKKEILQKLGGVMPTNRREFWKNLPVSLENM